MQIIDFLLKNSVIILICKFCYGKWRIKKIIKKTLKLVLILSLVVLFTHKNVVLNLVSYVWDLCNVFLLSNVKFHENQSDIQNVLVLKDLYIIFIQIILFCTDEVTFYVFHWKVSEEVIARTLIGIEINFKFKLNWKAVFLVSKMI